MSDSSPPKGRRRIRALLLSDRIDTSNLEHDHVVSTAPLTYKFGKDGHVTLFRYGVAVLMGLTGPEENEVLRGLQKRLIRPHARQGRSNSSRRPDYAEDGDD